MSVLRKLYIEEVGITPQKLDEFPTVKNVLNVVDTILKENGIELKNK